MPSNEERTTACGVSSMMKSTPVRCSRERMLRPSRPMMRPFMSSDGSSTTDTVVSAAWLPGARVAAGPKGARAYPLERVRNEIARAALRFGAGLFLELPDPSSELVPDEILRAFQEAELRFVDGHARDPLELGELLLARVLVLLLELTQVCFAIGEPLLAAPH